MSSSTSTDLWGQDIALDDNGQAKVSASGEFILTSGVETGVQDIKLRLFTRLGELFYDTGFGSLIHDWILEENTSLNRIGFCAEVTMRIEADPRVKFGSVKTQVLLWNETQLHVAADFEFIGADQPTNLVLQYNKSTKALVIKDVNPSDSSTAEIIQNP